MPTIRLNVTHTHAGIAYPSGTVIDVDDYTGRWLIDHQIGTLAALEAPSEAAPEATPTSPPEDAVPLVKPRTLKPTKE
jgi:hypothetical protein